MKFAFGIASSLVISSLGVTMEDSIKLNEKALRISLKEGRDSLHTISWSKPVETRKKTRKDSSNEERVLLLKRTMEEWKKKEEGIFDLFMDNQKISIISDNEVSTTLLKRMMSNYLKAKKNLSQDSSSNEDEEKKDTIESFLEELNNSWNEFYHKSEKQLKREAFNPLEFYKNPKKIKSKTITYSQPEKIDSHEKFVHQFLDLYDDQVLPTHFQNCRIIRLEVPCSYRATLPDNFNKLGMITEANIDGHYSQEHSYFKLFGLQQLPFLKKLILRKIHIQDPRSFKELKSLKKLWYMNSQGIDFDYLPTLTELFYRNESERSFDFSLIKKIPTLEIFTFDNIDLQIGTQKIDFTHLEGHPSLTTLNTISEPQDYAVLAKIPHLKNLSIDGTDLQLNHIEMLENLVSLKTQSSVPLFKILTLKNLQELCFQWRGWGGVDVFHDLGKMTQLKNLEILYGMQLQADEFLPPLVNLERLALFGTIKHPLKTNPLLNIIKEIDNIKLFAFEYDREKDQDIIHVKEFFQDRPIKLMNVWSNWETCDL